MTYNYWCTYNLLLTSICNTQMATDRLSWLTYVTIYFWNIHLSFSYLNLHHLTTTWHHNRHLKELMFTKSYYFLVKHRSSYWKNKLFIIYLLHVATCHHLTTMWHHNPPLEVLMYIKSCYFLVKHSIHSSFFYKQTIHHLSITCCHVPPLEELMYIIIKMSEERKLLLIKVSLYQEQYFVDLCKNHLFITIDFWLKTCLYNDSVLS